MRSRTRLTQTVCATLAALGLASCGASVREPAPDPGRPSAHASGATPPPRNDGLVTGRCRRGVLPDRRCSPGRTFHVSAPEVCVPGYSARARNVPQSRKDKVYAAYGILSHRPYEYEIDHLISLELGGSNSAKNLFPEAYGGSRGAEDKDRLENRLHALVCSGAMSLRRAQRLISGNWVLAAKQYPR